MNNYYIISNIDRDPDMAKAEAVSNYLKDEKRNCNKCFVSKVSLGDDSAKNSLKLIPDNTDCAIVLGGDGTIIQVAQELAKKNIPLMGVNIGHLGFLAEIEYCDVYTALDKLNRGEYFIENRMMLSGNVYLANENYENNLALNDVVISRSGAMKMASLDVYVNDKFLTTIKGDGIVVSTPTGSTAYSMSAGGPIVEPDSYVILITPISAHNLNSRPVVLSAEDEIKIRVKSQKYDENSGVTVSFDGGKSYNLEKDDDVIIKKASVETKILKISKESFLEVLSRKFYQFNG